MNAGLSRTANNSTSSTGDIMTEENQTEIPSLADTVFAAFGQETPEEYRAQPIEAAPEKPETRDDGRDDKGRFAPRQGEAPKPEEPDAKQPDAPNQAKPDQPSEQEAPAADAIRPPPGWSVASKSAWDNLPAEVKSDIAKREQEVSEGFKQYTGLKDVIPYQQHYAREGASVKQALDAYTALDRQFTKDPVATVAYMAEQKGVDPVRMALAILQQRGIQIPQGEVQPQHAQPQVFRDPRVDDLLRLREEEQRSREMQDQHSAEQTIGQFAADPANRYFENVKVTMGYLIQTGQASDLKDAYDKACWANPEIRQQLINQQQAAQVAASQPQRQAAAAAQARQSAKSITGSPMPGASPAAKPRKMSDREAIEEGLRAQGVAV